MRKYLFKSSSFTLLLFLILPEIGFSQVAITAVPFLQINTDARSRGMGEATVAMLNGPGGIHLNPATIGTKNSVDFYSGVNFEDGYGLFDTPWLPKNSNDDIYLRNPGISVGFNTLSVGYQHTYFSVGERAITGPYSPDPISSFDSYEYVHTFSASYQITDHIYLGAGLNFGKSALAPGAEVNGQEVDSPTFTTVDIGIYADRTYSFDDMLITSSFGWSLTDFGEPIGYVDGEPKDPIPMMMRGGFGLKLESEEKILGRTAFSFGGYASLSKIMARKEMKEVEGQTVYEAMGPWEALFNSWGSYTRFDGQGNVELSLIDQLQTQTGFELIFIEVLSIRFGHFYEHPLNGDRSYDTFGFGLHYKYFSLDYSEIDIEDPSHPLAGTSFLQFKVNVPLAILGDIGL